MELICYWNLMDWLRPFIRKAISFVLGDCLRDLEQIDQMAGPRVIKSHLPLYLLNPSVLNTSKVCVTLLLLFFIIAFTQLKILYRYHLFHFPEFCYGYTSRLSTWLAIPKMLSFHIIITTGCWNSITTQATWKLSPITS